MNSHPGEYQYFDAAQGFAFAYVFPAVLRLLGPPKGKVLDMGCGNGALANALIGRGYDVYGVDSSVSGIDFARRLHPDRFFLADFASGALPAAICQHSFDAIVSTEVLEHLYDPRAFLRLAHAALAPGGVLIVSTPYHGYLKNAALALSGRLDAHFTVMWDGGHIKFFSRRTLEAMLREVGFRPAEFAGVGRIPQLWKSMIIKAVRE